jgi:hypothetical protein
MGEILVWNAWRLAPWLRHTGVLPGLVFVQVCCAMVLQIEILPGVSLGHRTNNSAHGACSRLRKIEMVNAPICHHYAAEQSGLITQHSYALKLSKTSMPRMQGTAHAAQGLLQPSRPAHEHGTSRRPDKARNSY